MWETVWLYTLLYKHVSRCHALGLLGFACIPHPPSGERIKRETAVKHNKSHQPFRAFRGLKYRHPSGALSKLKSPYYSLYPITQLPKFNQIQLYPMDSFPGVRIYPFPYPFPWTAWGGGQERQPPVFGPKSTPWNSWFSLISLETSFKNGDSWIPPGGVQDFSQCTKNNVFAWGIP